MAMSPTCFYFSLHGAKQKVKKFLAEAPFTRYTGMAGPGACDFTKKTPTACAKHAWSSDHGFTQQRLLCCQNCTWFMLPFSILVLTSTARASKENMFEVHQRTSLLTPENVTPCYNTAHSSFVIVKYTGCIVSTAGLRKAW